MKRLFFLLIVTIPFLSISQAPDHAWLVTNQIRARINADGRLFCDDTTGAFFVPRGDSMVTIIRAAGLWLGGGDVAGNILMSAQMYSPDSSDFTAGFRGIPNSGRVWKVTRMEIEAHRKDYLEDGVVDNPIPAIFGWPGKSNDFFVEYNDFRLPDSMAFAGFEEPDFQFFNDEYEPWRGEYPRLTQSTNAIDIPWLVPDELIFFAFHSGGQQNLIKTEPFPVQVWGEAYVFHCTENDLLENSVFVTYRWRYEGTERSDTVSAAIFADVDLGNPRDDYQGYLPDRQLYFVYNSDSTDAAGWDNGAPLLFVKPFYFPITNMGDETGFHLMPLGCGEACNWLGGTSLPEHFLEYFNYLTGRWRDGSPLQAGELGYHTGGMEMPGAFPGLPDAPGAWTEWNEHNPKGDRRALLRFYLHSTLPKRINGLTQIFSYAPPDSTPASQKILNWLSEYDKVWYEFVCCINFDVPPPFPDCYYKDPVFPSFLPLTVFPNPANDVLKVWHKDLILNSLCLYDASGVKVAIGNHIGFISEVPVQHLPMGIYFLEIIDETGTRTVKKVMVAH